MTSQTYRQAVAGFGDTAAVFTDPPTRFREWLADKHIPEPLSQILLHNALLSDVESAGGGGGLWTWEDIIELNEQESAILAAGLLAIGNSIGGDFIVIDLIDNCGSAGFVSHDELWENCPSNVRDIYVQVDVSIDLMLIGIAAELRHVAVPPYPIDYCDAMERLRSN